MGCRGMICAYPQNRSLPKDRCMPLTSFKILAFLTLITPVLALAQADSTLDKVKKSGTITLGYRESSIPFSYLDDKAQTVGFSHEICLKIVENVKKATGRADLKVQLQPVSSANRIPLLQNGTIDIECGSTTNNSERAKQVQFAINYFYTGTRFLVKTGTQVKSIDDLKGKTVVSTTGTTNLKILRNLNEEKNLGMELLSAKDHPDSALMVETGRAVAFGMDDILLYGLRAASQNPASLAVVGEPIQVEPYAIMLRRDDPAFKKLVDDTLTTLMKSGEFTKLYTKWFMSPIPPKGINLNAPMSKELLDNITALSDKPAT
jgi:ABC-type amino acid transport substrate-binding protein